MPDNVLDALEKVKYLKESSIIKSKQKVILEGIITELSMTDLVTIHFNILVLSS